LGKPLLAYGIEQLKDVGVRDIVLVVGWLGSLFKNKIGNGERFGVRIRYVTQEKRLGVAHAIALAVTEGNITQDFIVYLGDNLMDDEWIPKFKKMVKEDYDSILFLAKVPDPRRFGVAVIRDEKIVGFVEKPKTPPSNYALTGLYYFRDPEEYMDCFRTLKPSWRGEYEITDIINCYLKRNKRIGFVTIERWWKDAGRPKDLIEAMMMIMDSRVKDQRILGKVYGEVEGNVIVEEGAEVYGKVKGPAYIGKSSVVGEGAVISGYVDLEGGATFKSGYARRSLILEGALLDLNDSTLLESIVGAKSTIKAKRGVRTTISLVGAQESFVELRQY
jgi:glucose-1-phosphate thymidylyltransferase